MGGGLTVSLPLASPAPRQSPSAACTSASAATPAVSARRIRGPSDSRSVLRLPQQQRAFFLGKSAFGADQDVDPVSRG